MNRLVVFLFLAYTVFLSLHSYGQEQVGPIRYNPFLHARQHHKAAARTTIHTLTLPFFEDFTGYGLYPDSTRWTDEEVYINNTMCLSPISRGVATFDALNSNGTPYDSFSNTSPIYADSLTSQAIDISGDSASDSVYLSFFYQPQGNGFYPTIADSLMLYFKDKYGQFILVWAIPGPNASAPYPFQQVMIPITDTLYLHNSFQFRFVNIASLNWADANWNIDYIKLDKNRSAADTIINDVGFTTDPTFLLNDYTSMPYRQFYAAAPAETAPQYSDSIHNNYNTAQTINYGYSALALNTGAILQFPTAATSTMLPYTTQQLTYTSYALTISPPDPEARVVFENTYFIRQVSPTDPPGNDTIVKDQIFDNYLAYDDGTAEKSYYLNLYPTLPGKIAVEYHLNQPDTLRGMAIYFGRQIPFASYKLFSIYIYSALAGINGAPFDVKLDSVELLSPGYADTINHFWVYRMNKPLLLPTGTFYAGILQPAQSGSDSLYIGLDVNRIGGNHAYFNVTGFWEPSLVSGALMIRPLLGQYVPGTSVTNVQVKGQKWQVTPNPAKDLLQFEFDGDNQAVYYITDIQGQEVQKGTAASGKSVDISALTPGIYFVSLVSEKLDAAPQKIIKL